VARSVGRLLTQPFTLNLHYRRLGPLLQKSVRLTRIGLPADSPDSVELCCAFDAALGDEESVILQIPLPPLDATAAWCPEEALPAGCNGSMNFFPEATEEAPPSAPEAPLPRHRLRAFVSGTRRDAPASIFCHTDLVTVVGVRVRLPRAAATLARKGAPAGPREAAEAFVELFGHTILVRLLHGEEDVWQGASRVSGVELPPERPEEMLVTLAFAQRLRPSELRALGLLAA
jgi:hypothetical protein